MPTSNVPWPTRLLLVLACVSVLGFASAIAEEPAKSGAPKDAGVAAYVGNEPISLQELDAVALKSNMKLAQSLYDARRAALDQLVLEKVLGAEAKSKNTSVDALLRERIAAKVKPVTDADVEAYYNANSARMRGQTLEQTKEPIRNFLVSQNEQAARADITKELLAKSNVRVVLEVPRIEVKLAANDPVKGPTGAKVTIVEFSEFQ